MQDLGDRGVRIPGDFGYDYADQVEPAGDFNGDGLADLLISSGADSLDAEGLGSSSAGPARTVELGDFQGEGVRILCQAAVHDDMAGGGDFDGDGVDDVVVAGTRNQAGRESVYVVFGSTGEPEFVRGNASGDRDLVISDPIFLLGALFLGEAAPPCDDAADANDDGKLDITDAILRPLPPLPRGDGAAAAVSRGGVGPDRGRAGLPRSLT